MKPVRILWFNSQPMVCRICILFLWIALFTYPTQASPKIEPYPKNNCLSGLLSLLFQAGDEKPMQSALRTQLLQHRMQVALGKGIDVEAILKRFKETGTSISHRHEIIDVLNLAISEGRNLSFKLNEPITPAEFKAFLRDELKGNREVTQMTFYLDVSLNPRAWLVGVAEGADQVRRELQLKDKFYCLFFIESVPTL